MRPAPGGSTSPTTAAAIPRSASARRYASARSGTTVAISIPSLIADGRLVAADREVIEEVEPTGAGDAFDGVLLSSLARGRAPEEALARACHAGALVAASHSTWPEEIGA